MTEFVRCSAQGCTRQIVVEDPTQPAFCARCVPDKPDRHRVGNAKAWRPPRKLRRSR